MKQKTDLLPTWDLSAIYKTTQNWEDDFKRLPGLADAFEAYQGRLNESSAIVLEALKTDESYSRLLEKLYAYAMLKADEDTRISENKERLGRLQTAYASMAPKFAWFTPEFVALPKDIQSRHLNAPELASHKRILEEMLRGEMHTLSAVEEKILGSFSEILGAPSRIFSTLNNSDLSFGKLRDEKGNLVELTHGSYRILMESPDRNTRRRTFRRLYETYRKFRNTFAASLDATVKQHAASAATRHYASSLSAALFADNIPETVYRNLIDAVHQGLPHLHRYLGIRKRMLGIDSFDMWDIYNPILPEFRLEYTWEEAVALARKAIRPMGKEYGKIFDLAFSQRWIDVPERKGKRSGAYSGGCYDTYPYILLNFQGNLNDVFTLVHEGGHSLHSYYSRQTQPYQYSDYKIFVAEVASTTNEILLAEYLLATSKDKNLTAYLLSHLIDEIRGTVIRQTMFAEFELFMHETADQGGTLTADLLDKKYYELNNLYHGFKADRLIALEWARIPHFYYNFYVYKYATGMAAAVKLANGILHGGPDCLERYLNFLKAGSSKDVLDILRDAGADMEQKAPVTDVMNYFGSLVDRLDG